MGFPLPNFNYWILQALAMMLTALLIPKLKITSIFGPFTAVVALATVNSWVWDAALFFQLPSSFTTQAGLLLVTNGVIFWILAKMLPGIEIEGFLPAILAPVVFTLSSLVISEYGKEIDWQGVFETVYGIFQHLKEYFQSSAVTAPEVNLAAVNSELF